MSTMFDDVDSKCPYFMRSDKKKIVCEGICNDSVISNEFKTVVSRDCHKAKYCNKLNNDCLVKRMLDQKWGG